MIVYELTLEKVSRLSERMMRGKMKRRSKNNKNQKKMATHKKVPLNNHKNHKTHQHNHH